MLTLRDKLLRVADAYVRQIDHAGGKSLARVSTIVLNQGAFFRRLREGKSCTIDSYEAIVRWFADPRNWPGGVIPETVGGLLSASNTASAEAE